MIFTYNQPLDEVERIDFVNNKALNPIGSDDIDLGHVLITMKNGIIIKIHIDSMQIISPLRKQ